MIDLHTHTDRSDGSTAPDDLVRQAFDIGLEALGISDHDTLAGARVPTLLSGAIKLVTSAADGYSSLRAA